MSVVTGYQRVHRNHTEFPEDGASTLPSDRRVQREVTIRSVELVIRDLDRRIAELTKEETEAERPDRRAVERLNEVDLGEPVDRPAQRLKPLGPLPLPPPVGRKGNWLVRLFQSIWGSCAAV